MNASGSDDFGKRGSMLNSEMAMIVCRRIILGGRGCPKRIAEEFGCSVSLIYEIKRGRCWKKEYRKAMDLITMEQALEKMRNK